MTTPETAAPDTSAAPQAEPEAPAPRRTGLALAALLARLTVGALFVIAGYAKIADPARFLKEVRAYELAPTSITNAMANYLPWLELIAALFLLACVFRREARWILLAMLAAFTVAKLIVFVQGKPIECGCGGNLEFLKYIFNNPQGIATNLALIGLLLLDAHAQRRGARLLRCRPQVN